MEKELLATLKEKLEQEKASLEKELESFAVEDKNLKDNWDAKRPKSPDADMEEKADESQEYENLLSLEHSLELKLKDVNQALEKIEKGEYGICERCGKQIEQDRLMAYPGGRLCISCNNNK